MEIDISACGADTGDAAAAAADDDDKVGLPWKESYSESQKASRDIHINTSRKIKFNEIDFCLSKISQIDLNFVVL